MPKTKLTKLFIDGVGLEEEDGRRQQLYWDTELKGFGILISKTAKSFVIQRFGKPDFGRVRIGIGRPTAGFKGDPADWVLSPFSSEEREKLPTTLKRYFSMKLTLPCALVPPLVCPSASSRVFLISVKETRCCGILSAKCPVFWGLLRTAYAK